MKTTLTLAACAVALSALSGCAMSGYEDQFSCPKTEFGAPCMSAIEAYHDSDVLSPGTAPQAGEAGNADDANAVSLGPDGALVIRRSNYSVDPRQSPLDNDVLPGLRGTKPVRTPAHIMRIYIAPWVSTDGALTMAQYVFTEITPRTWTIGERAPDVDGRSFYPLQVQRTKTGTGHKPTTPVRGKPRQ